MLSILLGIGISFEEAFAPIEIKFDWGFFFGLLGTYLGVLSLVKGNKTTKRKLELKQADLYNKTRINNAKNENVSVFYKGEPAENLFEAQIFLENTGNIELKQDDFNTPCKLTFTEEVEILEYTISSSDRFTGAQSYIEDNSISIVFSFIEPQTYIQIIVLFKSTVIPEANFSINIVSGEKKIYNSKSYNSESHYIGMSHDSSGVLIIIFLCFGLVLPALAYLFSLTLGVRLLDDANKIAIPWGWFSLLLTIAFIPSFILFRSIYRQLSFVKENWFDVKAWTVVEHIENKPKS